MQSYRHARHLITGMLLVCYLLPVVLLTVYNAMLVPANERWQLLSIGLLCSMLGTLILTLLMRRWELQLVEYQESARPIPEPVLAPIAIPQPPAVDDGRMKGYLQEVEQLKQTLEISQDLQEALNKELLQQKNLCQRLVTDKEELQQQCERLDQGLTAHQERSSDLLRAKEAQLLESQQTLSDQQALLEKKQKQITHLENTVRDLKYELKTLIDLTDRIQTLHDEDVASESDHTPPAPPTPAPTRSTSRSEPTPYYTGDAPSQLRRCIDIAQKLTGARHLTGHTPRFQDLSADGYALDLRRLCDSLRSENFSMILLFSQKDEKLLFVNNQVKGALGWTPEKFVQDFSDLIVDGRDGWQAAMRQLTPSSPVTIDLTLKSKAGDNKRIHFHLGIIPTGIFKTHVVAVANQLPANALEEMAKQ